MKKIKFITLILIVSLLSTGCLNNEDYKNTLKEISQIDTGISETMNNVTKLSSAEKEQLIYQQVTDRTLLDTTALTAVSETNTKAINYYINDIKKQLLGYDVEVLDSNLVNYLLFEMQKTPYIWNISKANILGVDSNTESFIVDVEFVTSEGAKIELNDTKKDNIVQESVNNSTLDLNLVDESGKKLDNTTNITVTDTPTPTPVPKVEDIQVTKGSPGKLIVPKSVISRGCENYNKKMQVRYENYIKIIKAKNGMGGMGFNWNSELKNFENLYGSIKNIMVQQKSDTLVDSLKKGYLLGYEGLCDTELEKSQATMTVRFILNYSYIYGINKGLVCNHAYITNYDLNSNILENREELSAVDYKDLISEVDSLIYSEMKAIEEDSYIALNSLIDDFGKLDSYYYDMFEYTFRKYKGYAISIYNINGTKVEACVTRVRKIRAKGSNMSYPIYEEKVLYTIDLFDDKLKIVNEVIVSSKIIGEPSIVVADKEVELFSDNKEISEEEKTKLYGVIKEFNKLQIEKDVQSENFVNIVDIGLTASNLNTLRSNMLNIENVNKKVTWVESINDRYSNYASFTLKEIFFKDDGSAVECKSDIGLIQKSSDVWQVVSYCTKEIVNVDSTKLDLTGYMDTLSKNQ